MSQYVMLEANRMAGLTSYNQQDDDSDEFKNSWINNVSQSGIEIEKGDIISVDTTAIQTQGSIQDTIEIEGSENYAGFLDNKVDLVYGCYINHSGTNTIPLPFLSQETYLTSNDSTNSKLPATLRDFTTKLYSRNRGIGDVNLSDYTQYTGDYRNHNNVPTNYSFINIRVLNGGTDIETNSVYADATGTYKIKAISVESGVLTYYTLIEIPEGTSLGDKNEVKQITFTTNITNSTSPPKIDPIVQFYLCDFKTGSTKNNIIPDGSRYYPPNKGFSGCCLISDGLPGDTASFNASKLQPGYQIRQKIAKIEVPTGLNSPGNLSAIITDQLQRPKNISFSKTDFVNLESYGRYAIETPSSFITPCNFNTVVSPYDSVTFTGVRQYWYSNIAYKNPEKIEGLQFFRQFAYGSDNTVSTNEINSGSNASQSPNIGDCFSQTIGNFGLTPIITRPIPLNTVPVNTVNIPIGGLILTNIKLTKDVYKSVIDKIANGFRIAEKYYGDRTINLSSSNPNYLSGLAIPLDLGMYCDEFTPVTDPSKTYPRFRFMSCTEADAITNPSDYIIKEVGSTTSEMVGTQPPWFDDDVTRNDGSQLSCIVVSSRYTDVYDEKELFESMSTALTNTPYFRNDLGYSRSNFYQGKLSNDILSYAKSADVAIVPCYPEYIGADKNTEPYLAFVNHLSLNDPDISYNKETSAGWRIDSQNCFTGIQIGFDASFTRNPAVAMINTNFRDTIIDETKTASDDYASFEIQTLLPGGPYYVYTEFINSEDESDFWRTGIPVAIPDSLGPGGGGFRTFTVGRLIKPGSEISFKVYDLATDIYITDFTTQNITIISGGKSPSAVISEFSPFINLGAYGNQVLFNPILSRFEISDMNTSTTIGNGQPYVLPGLRQELGLTSTAPNQQCLNYAVNEICYSYCVHGNLILTPAFKGRTSNNKIVDSQTGISLLGIGLYSQDNKITYQLYNQDKTLNIRNSLLDKMGFELEQLLPSIGGIQTKFNDYPTFKNEINTYQSFLEKFTRPLTTSAVFGSAVNQALQTSADGEPLFLLGAADGEESQPLTTQGALTAFNLPSQLSYPYLLVYSSLIQGGTASQYRGGNDSQALIPCMATIDRYNNSGSFFYGNPSSFDYTATRNFVVSEIQTDIRLPNGQKPRLLSQSSVIYKIIKPLRLTMQVDDEKSSK